MRVVFQADAATRKNKLGAKPNEDRYYCAPAAGVVCIANGVSRIVTATDPYPTPSLAELAATRLVEQAGALRLTFAARTEPVSETHLVEVFRATSAALGAYVQEHGPFDLYKNDYPGTIGTLIVASQDTLAWAHLGDTSSSSMAMEEPY